MRDDTNASNFYHYAVKRASQHEMTAEPTTEKKRRRPNYSILQYVDGCAASGSAHYPETAEDMYRSLYFEVTDFLASTIEGSL